MVRAGEFPFHLLPYASQSLRDGSLAHLPWLQEMPDPLTSAMWSSWVELNPKTAERLQILPGELVEIASPAWQRARARHTFAWNRTRLW